MKIFRNRTVVGVLCILLALIICFGVTPLFSRSASEKTEIVRVTKDIKEGDEITAEMVQTVEVGAYNLPQNLMTDKKEVVGKYATADLAAGDYILSSKLSAVPAAENAYLYNLDGKKQAISVTIKSFATGLSGKLESGDIVTVIVADYQGKGETAIPPELQYVEVISVTASSGYDANTGEVVDEKELPSTVTLLVTTEQATVRLTAEAARVTLDGLCIFLPIKGGVSMSNEIMQENTPFVECSAFHRGMSVLEASLRNTEDSDAIISGLLKGAAEFYGASRASVVEADWDLGIGVITYEWCKDGVSAQRDMLQCLPMEKFPRWRKALRANKPVVISDLQRLEKVYPDEAAFFREYGVTTLLAAPFSKRINQGFIAVDDPTRYTDDPVFLFIASYAVVVELNEIKQQQSLLAATKASKYNPEDIHVNFFGGMEIISSKGTLTGEDIKADQCYLLLAYLILNHKKNSTVDTLAEIICPYDELDSPYKVVNNIVYRLRRTLSVIGLDKLVIGKNGTFQINPNFNIHTDFDRFEDACIQLKTEENPDMRHSLYHSAVDMYKGQLLPRCEHELWLMQLSMYYQSLYLQITKGYVRLKMECKDYILAQKTAIDALRFDPKDSELNMYAILAMGFQGNLSMAQTYYTAAKPYLALEHAEVIKKYLNIK